MATARLRERMPSAKPLGVATLSGHELRFHKSSKDGSGKCNAFATDDDESAVVGVLFSFDPSERRKLDAAEGAGKGYEATMVTVVNHKRRRRKVLTYIASNEAIDDNLKPYSWYKEHVLAGGEEHGLPQDYIDERIAKVEAVEDADIARAARARATHSVIR